MPVKTKGTTSKRRTKTTSMGPLLDQWTGDHGGFARFDKITKQDMKPAILKGMQLKRSDLKAITRNKRDATFTNTIAALENSGRPLGRATSIFGIFTSTMNDKEMQAIDSDMSPIFAQFSDEVIQNEALFARIKGVHDERHCGNLTEEQKRVVASYYDDFTRHGAAVSAKKKKRLGAINQRLATLYTSFSQKILAEEEKYRIVLETEADRAGLPASVLDAAASQAKELGMDGKYVITNTRSSMEPFITFSSRRDLREKGFHMWTNRGNNNDENDTKATIAEMVQLRAEKAKILGFNSFADWAVANNMAKNPQAAMDLMLKVWKPAVARAHEEVADMQALADARADNITIEPWDYRYYGELVRKQKYDVDEDTVKQYLQLDKMLAGMFFAANQVYGIEMVQVHGLPTVHPDVTVYEVRRGGKQIGLWYFDPYARSGKSSGAWMSEYRTQEKFRGTVLPVVSNNSNFVKGQPGEPVLISWDDANTMFHEFGHALHGLLSNVNYPSVAGTAVKRDFVEFPSQVNERWLSTNEVLKKFAVHYKTGEPIPDELVAKIKKAKTFNKGFDTVEFLASAIYDMKLHLAATPDATIDPVEFERQAMAEIGCPKEIVMRHRPTQFGHIFSGDGYSAGYYVYIWADAFSADAAEAFVEAGSFYDRATCDRFAATIFSVGNSVAPDVAFRNFRGRDVDVNALMRDRGFPVA